MLRNIRFHELTGPSVLGLVAAFSVATSTTANAQMIGPERAYLNRLESAFPATTILREVRRSAEGELALLGRTEAAYPKADPVGSPALAVSGTRRIGGEQALLGRREKGTEK